MPRVALVLLCAAVAFPVVTARDQGSSSSVATSTARRMSFHNRLLLNRAALAGMQSIEVLLLVKGRPDQPPPRLRSSSFVEVADAVERLGGRVVRTEHEIGYFRVELPPQRLIELVASPDVEAYQISSLSRGAWYRDTPPLANAQGFRGSEVTPIEAADATDTYSHLPELTPVEARAPGFTADDDVGVGEWMKNHPTFDGRGVTIAILESALPSFADPVFRMAKTLDGRNVPKIIGIVNTLAPEHDETRVSLNTAIDAVRSWVRVGNRTYIVPRPGKYRMGVLEVPGGGNIVQQFGVLLDETSGEVRIDANGDASFQDETPLPDVNERFEPRSLKVMIPQPLDVSFVMSRGRDPDVVHIYLGKGMHQTMTASVVAGNRTVESLASGVAPNSRLLFVRMYGADHGLRGTVEGFIQAARREDVDVITSPTGLHIIPDTAGDFLGMLFNRLASVYRKPIINAGGNFGLMIGHVQAHGSALSVGGTLGPATHSAFYGGPVLPGLIVHPWSPAGPSLDGAIEPDFLAPMERIAATPPWMRELEAVPDRSPARRVPPGYAISCCTSASSPYAAGVVALLISAARQMNVPYSAESLGYALRSTARPIPGFLAHQQGNGALDIEAAWRAMTTRFGPPRIVASAHIVHPLARYAARGEHGIGILEFGGWTIRMTGSRWITLRRETGPAEPVTYRLAWSADDGTFSTPSSVTLPLGEPVPLRVDVDVRQTGAHSGLLSFHDRAMGAVAFRTQATIVAPERVGPATSSLEVTGTVAPMQQSAHYFHVPAGAGAIALHLEVSRGALNATLIQSHGLVSTYYTQTHPMDIFSVGPGTYHLLMPNPEPGTWTLRFKNASIRAPAKDGWGPRNDQPAEYAFSMHVLDGTIELTANEGSGVTLHLTNGGSVIAAPIVDASAGTLKTHHATFHPSGLPNLIEIDVPPDAATLALDLRSESTDSDMELFLYDCTTGECFSYDIGFPAAPSQTLVVRKPSAGRWVTAVNAAPFPTAGSSFVLDEIITRGSPVRRSSTVTRQPGARWQEVFEQLPPSPDIQGRVPIVLFELMDAAAERAEVNHPWNPHPRFVRLRDRPVAIATAIYRR